MKAVVIYEGFEEVWRAFFATLSCGGWGKASMNRSAEATEDPKHIETGFAKRISHSPLLLFSEKTLTDRSQTSRPLDYRLPFGLLAQPASDAYPPGADT